MSWPRENLHGSTPYSDLKNCQMHLHEMFHKERISSRRADFFFFTNESIIFYLVIVILFPCTLHKQSPAPHIQLGETEAIWLGRSGIPPQNSMPTPLVYNGLVRITAGAWRAAKGTQRSLVCLFYKPLPCSACKVPVGFVELNSPLNQTPYSGSTIAATLQPLRARWAE